MGATYPSERLARPLMVAGAVLLAAAVPMLIAIAGRFPDGAVWFVPFTATCAGGIVAVRSRPESLAARRLLLSGVGAMIWLLAGFGLLLAHEAAGREWWLGPANVVVQTLGLATPVATVALLAVYPDGVHHRRYERVAAQGFLVAAVAVPLLLLVARPELLPAWFYEWTAQSPGSGFPAFPELASPLHAGALEPLAAPLAGYHEAALGIVPLAAACLAFLRHRHLSPQDRLRMRWPLLGACALLVLPVEQLLFARGVVPLPLSSALEIAVLVALPASVVVGLLRPDLFDVGRALVYVALWLAIAAAYAGIAAALGLAVSGEGLQLAIAVTIVATLLIDPARRALLRRAARWAYGESVSGDELLRRLGATLEHTLDLDALCRGIAANARDGLGAGWARLEVDGLGTLTEGRAGDPAALTAPLVHAGERLGELTCGPRVRGRARADDRQRLETLARQAALAIHNARLAAELAERLEELAASRSRIVAAEEAGRRQIGRDIHDGAQQELVALIARLALARNQLRRDPARLDETFGDLQAEAAQALENLRRLATGIHPPVLSDRGLVEAIESRAARLPVGVTIECDPGMRDARFGEATEGAAYFFVSEALTNALKHSGAERLRVRLLRRPGELELEVSDDGAGFDPAAVARSGLGGLADRLEALGGSLTVDAAPGRGTRLTARLPAAQPAVV